MSEGVTFWLDIKHPAGITVARPGKKILVNYREMVLSKEGLRGES